MFIYNWKMKSTNSVNYVRTSLASVPINGNIISNFPNNLFYSWIDASQLMYLVFWVKSTHLYLMAINASFASSHQVF